jgi:4-oxalocrotonate tautomerase
MPLIEVKLIEGVFSQAQKQEMIAKLTDTMVSIEGENMRGVTSVVIEEVKSGDWGIGGKSLTTADAKALAAGQPAGQARGTRGAERTSGRSVAADTNWRATR